MLNRTKWLIRKRQNYGYFANIYVYVYVNVNVNVNVNVLVYVFIYASILFSHIRFEVEKFSSDKHNFTIFDIYAHKLIFDFNF